MDWFENWFCSPYYRILYQNRDEQEAQEFLEKLLGYLQPPQGSLMLDIACGDGRFGKQLAEHGHDVTGIDISPASIATAKAHETEHLRFYVHDMRLPFVTNYFDFAFNFFTSFGYFAHDRDHIQAAKSFAGALKPGALLVVDYLNQEYVHANLVKEETITRGSYVFHISRKLERQHFLKEISFADVDGQQKKFTESVAAFSLADFTRIFSGAGLSLVSTFGDYNLTPYHPANSPRLVMIFKKTYA